MTIDKPTIDTTLDIQECDKVAPPLEPGQALIEGKVCTLIQADTPADNYWASVEDGDFVAYAVEPEFKVDSLGAYDFVMGLMLTQEAEIAAVEMSPEVIKAKAVIVNAEKLRKKHYNRLAWLELRFKEEMAVFARTQFKGKEKTFTSLLGSVSCRSVAGKVAVIKEAAGKALEWAKSYCTDAVKVTEEFQISGVPKPLKHFIQTVVDPDTHPDELEIALDSLAAEVRKTQEIGGAMEVEDVIQEQVAAIKAAFIYEPPKENVSISTGVAKA